MNEKSLPICVNCEENEVSSKGMIICDDCIVHLEPEKQQSVSSKGAKRHEHHPQDHAMGYCSPHLSDYRTRNNRHMECVMSDLKTDYEQFQAAYKAYVEEELKKLEEQEDD